jgi:hypothetical protein
MPEIDAFFLIVSYLLRINLNKSLENGINGDEDFFRLQKLMELLLILDKYFEKKEKENLGNDVDVDDVDVDDDDDLVFPEDDENDNLNLSRLPLTRNNGVILGNDDDDLAFPENDDEEDEIDVDLICLPMIRH